MNNAYEREAKSTNVGTDKVGKIVSGLCNTIKSSTDVLPSKHQILLRQFACVCILSNKISALSHE